MGLRRADKQLCKQNLHLLCYSMERPDVSQRMKKARIKIEYPLTNEPWGVRRFFVKDPFDKLVNVLSHED